MIEDLKLLIPNFSHFEESKIIDNQHNLVGYQSVIVTKTNQPLSGGTSVDLNVARKICIAEAIERLEFLRASKDRFLKQKLELDKFPSTCGFAAGFDLKTTQFRSICESIERWAWSKWIDERFKIEYSEPINLSNLSIFLKNEFEKIYFFQKKIKLQDEKKPIFIGNEFTWSVVIGVTENGIFPGSRVTSAFDEPWEHAIVEAWRHKKIFENELKNKELHQIADIYDRRIFNFATQGYNWFLSMLSQQKNDQWPDAKLHLHEQVANKKLSNLNYFVFRSLCEKYIGWDIGDETRFIY